MHKSKDENELDMRKRTRVRIACQLPTDVDDTSLAIRPCRAYRPTFISSTADNISRNQELDSVRFEGIGDQVQRESRQGWKKAEEE